MKRRPPRWQSHPMEGNWKFVVIHNQALFNQQRDTKIAESIKKRIEDEETLTDLQIKDLEKRRQELMKL